MKEVIKYISCIVATVAWFFAISEICKTSITAGYIAMVVTIFGIMVYVVVQTYFELKEYSYPYEEYWMTCSINGSIFISKKRPSINAIGLHYVEKGWYGWLPNGMFENDLHYGDKPKKIKIIIIKD
jgi:hypothetical protein